MLCDPPFQLRKPLSLLLALTATIVILRIVFYFVFPGNVATKLITDQKNTRENQPREISLLSWNIWFGNFKMAERMTALGEVIHRVRPDVIGLQEVTRKSLALLEKQSWYHRYNLIPFDISSEADYFVVILSVFPVQAWKGHRFQNSRMSRKLITANIEISRQLYLNVGTSHLESLASNTLQREIQLGEALDILSKSENACLMGDLNLEKNVDGEILLPYPWFDSWLSLQGNSEENGYTWNPIVNTMMKDKPSTMRRFDRVFCKLLDFKVKKMSIVGNRPLKNGVFPSDHFGLYTLLRNVRREEYSNQQKSRQDQKHLLFRRPQDH